MILNKKTLAWLLFTALLILLLFFSFSVMPAPSRPAPAPTDEEIVTRAEKSIGLDGVNISIIRRSDNFAVVNIVDMEAGGGHQIIARLDEDPDFKILWSGQDIPPCRLVSRYGIPPTVIPQCIQGIVLDRRDLLKYLYSYLFGRVELAL